MSSPTVTGPNPTHHFSLKARDGTTLFLTACDGQGKPKGLYDPDIYTKIPVDTTALKQTSGSSSYDIFDYPYSPIVQDDLSGGRAGKDFERDSTKYYDSYRCQSGRANIAYAGPLEKYESGLRSQDQHMPGSVTLVQLTGENRHLYKRFQASATYTTGKVWLLARRRGLPGTLTAAIYSDVDGTLDTLLTSTTVTYDRMVDTLSEWLNETLAQSLTSGNYYWLVVYGAEGDSESKHWKIAVEEAEGTTYHSETFDTTPTFTDSYDLYFRLTAADTDKTCIPFEYKEQQYFVISEASGAPKLYMAGDRGTADANTGELTKLKDSTKAWANDEWVGCVVMITDGLGKLEQQPWRVITANSSGELTVDTPWTITQDTTTEYVLLGAKLTEITGHGLTAPVTSVLVTTKGIILFAQGDSVNIRRAKFETTTGTWTATYADDGTNKAVFLAYKPQAKKIVKANNSDVNGDVSVAFAAPVEWATASHTFTATPIVVDSKYRRITALTVYPDLEGAEQALAFKTDLPFWVPESGTSPYPMDIEEMKAVRSQYNGRNPMRHGVYLYFPMLQGLERYYSGNVDDLGPNLGDGLPTNRRGPISAMQGYPGKFFITIDAGSTGYSSVMDSGGWHERYRAPKGQRILAMVFQVIPGTGLDRLWIFQGNDLVWLPFPSDSTNEAQDANYEYYFEFAVEHSRMHAGIFDVQKVCKAVKLQTESLEVDDAGQNVCWFEMDYRLNQDAEWTTLDDEFTVSPTQEIDFTNLYGIAGKRLQFRIRGYTRDKSKSPKFLALIVSAVIRVDLKNQYGPYSFILTDDEKAKGLRQSGDGYTAAEKLEILENWADASNDSMLLLNSPASICDEKMIFMNIGTRRQVGFKRTDGNEFTSDEYVVSVTFQDA